MRQAQEEFGNDFVSTVRDAFGETLGGSLLEKLYGDKRLMPESQQLKDKPDKSSAPFNGFLITLLEANRGALEEYLKNKITENVTRLIELIKKRASGSA